MRRAVRAATVLVSGVAVLAAAVPALAQAGDAATVTFRNSVAAQGLIPAQEEEAVTTTRGTLSRTGKTATVEARGLHRRQGGGTCEQEAATEDTFLALLPVDTTSATSIEGFQGEGRAFGLGPVPLTRTRNADCSTTLAVPPTAVQVGSAVPGGDYRVSLTHLLTICNGSQAECPDMRTIARTLTVSGDVLTLPPLPVAPAATPAPSPGASADPAAAVPPAAAPVALLAREREEQERDAMPMLALLALLLPLLRLRPGARRRAAEAAATSVLVEPVPLMAAAPVVSTFGVTTTASQVPLGMAAPPVDAVLGPPGTTTPLADAPPAPQEAALPLSPTAVDASLRVEAAATAGDALAEVVEHAAPDEPPSSGGPDADPLVRDRSAPPTVRRRALGDEDDAPV